MKRREYPKTIWRKRLIKGTFWTGFFLVLFLSVVAIVRVGNANSRQAEAMSVQPVEKKTNFAASVGAQSFAQNFAVQYFDWQNTDESQKNRAEHLKSFLAKGLDEQAGLSFDGMEWDSTFSTSQVWNVQETGKDTALITLRVQHMLKKTTPPDPTAVDAAKKDQKQPPQTKEEQKGPFEKYFVVPVKTDGKSFVVNRIPYFTAPPSKPDITSDTTPNENAMINDSILKSEINNGLSTFFKVYTTGTQDELSYYVKGNQIQSMNGILTFKEVKDLVVNPGNAKNEYKVYATVVFQENQSKGQVVYPYFVTLVKEQDRWFVKELKNQ